MNKNSGIKLLTSAIVLVGVLVMYYSKPFTPINEHQTNTNNFNEAIASQFNDNIRDVSARLQETEKKLTRMQQENAQLQEKIKKPKSDGSTFLKKELEALKEQVSSFKTKNILTYPLEDKPDISKARIKDLDELLEKTTPEMKETSLWQSESKETQAPAKTPYYTIPAGSDFSKVTLLTALIGEVPVDGKLMQPLFPFSAMIARGNLMAANGMQLPDDFVGMKVMGYSIGVGSFLDNISCVRAYVTSALFVFEDGHFVTVGKEQMKSSAELINNESIGYLTTPYGSPCIQGEYITNAPQVITSMVASSGIEGAGKSLSKWQMTYQTEGMNTLTTPTGNLDHAAAGNALGDGSNKLSEWLEKRIQGSFDMVFVPASSKASSNHQSSYQPTQLSLHINQTIAIDKEHNGRVLHYGHQSQTLFDNALR